MPNNRRLADGRQQQGTSFFAPAASFSADLAMLVHASMLLAFGGTLLAGCPAGFKHCLDCRWVLAGLASQNVDGGVADIGAVEIGPDAETQLGDHVFGQARVGTRGTALGAFETGGDTVRKLLKDRVIGFVGVGFQHGDDVTH
ncbi:hypothetical membrane protein [Glutamicibacter arilaitensis Re117]|uniref:Hypothetical membrane protein n=1 Tax=Glutamicibacter arilaitensis (strain DSM 16368 / CIP 108037 / IAM 15318 / JCM 13566 / NCIMB 14258 / Re117) TaxID=861360 RepID=A0ABM9PUP8_GLUAR|nr:hypothetical membrane protein [Glutamicibacter arilaitensis Re117]